MPKLRPRQAPLYQKVTDDDGSSFWTSGLLVDGREPVPDAAQRRAESRARVEAGLHALPARPVAPHRAVDHEMQRQRSLKSGMRAALQASVAEALALRKERRGR